MAEIKQAIYLINQGRKREAQSILTELIRSNPQEITAWFWYVETLDSLEKRIQLLETCLKQNPGNPQVNKALEMLRAKQSSDRLVASASSNPENPSPFSEYKETGGSKNTLYGEEPSTKTSYYANTRDEGNKNQENNIPNILIPANEKVIAHLKSVNVFHAMILPLSSNKINNDRLHPDYGDLFINKASSLPQNSKYVVYGFPALVHPETGIIFGYAMGMGNSYRLPEKIAEELQAYRDKELSRVRQKKVKKTFSDDSYSPPPLESNWVNSLSFTGKLLHKCYDYYGREQYKGSVVHLNVDEDLEKTPPPPTFLDKLLDRIFILSIPVVIFLIMLFFRDSLDYLFKYVIDLIKNR